MCRVRTLLVLTIMASGSMAHAQIASEGSIRGVVRDLQGVLPGATIAASSRTVAGIRTTVSDSQGDYRLTDLPPGEYTITGEL